MKKEVLIKYLKNIDKITDKSILIQNKSIGLEIILKNKEHITVYDLKGYKTLFKSNFKESISPLFENKDYLKLEDGSKFDIKGHIDIWRELENNDVLYEHMD